MTLLNWELAPEHVLILCDTLSLHFDDHRPRSMTTKVFFAPHLKTCVAGTGVALLATRFYLQLVESIIAEDVVHLNEYASGVLRNTFSQMTAPEMNAPQGLRGTLYTFGWSEREKQFTGFAYRSTNGFESERLQHGVGLKPAPDDPSVIDVHDLDSFIALARSQKEKDRARPRMERVGIGGDLYLYLMQMDEAGHLRLSATQVERFPDYQSDWDLLLSRLPENAGHALARMRLALDP